MNKKTSRLTKYPDDICLIIHQCLQQKRQAPSLRYPIGNMALSCLTFCCDLSEMFTPFQLRHPLEVKTNRLLDFHTLELHHIGAGAGVDLSDDTFPEDRMRDLVIDPEAIRRAFAKDGGLEVGTA